MEVTGQNCKAMHVCGGGTLVELVLIADLILDGSHPMSVIFGRLSIIRRDQQLGHNLS